LRSACSTVVLESPMSSARACDVAQCITKASKAPFYNINYQARLWFMHLLTQSFFIHYLWMTLMRHITKLYVLKNMVCYSIVALLNHSIACLQNMNFAI
jgi:hypothetical protein